MSTFSLLPLVVASQAHDRPTLELTNQILICDGKLQLVRSTAESYMYEGLGEGFRASIL